MPCEGDLVDCTLLEEWLRIESQSSVSDWRLHPSASPFASILGVSSVDVSLKKLDENKQPSPLQVS